VTKFYPGSSQDRRPSGRPRALGAVVERVFAETRGDRAHSQARGSGCGELAILSADRRSGNRPTSAVNIGDRSACSPARHARSALAHQRWPLRRGVRAAHRRDGGCPELHRHGTDHRSRDCDSGCGGRGHRPPPHSFRPHTPLVARSLRPFATSTQAPTSSERVEEMIPRVGVIGVHLWGSCDIERLTEMTERRHQTPLRRV
jgi:hypothetical protein